MDGCYIRPSCGDVSGLLSKYRCRSPGGRASGRNQGQAVLRIKKTIKYSEMNSIILSNGVRMPDMGIGTNWMKYKELKAVMEAGFSAGFRAIDTARDLWE